MRQKADSDVLNEKSFSGCLDLFCASVRLQLDEMCITFDGGNTRLNFAEAALLIQGSTCIYSKKVPENTAEIKPV